MNVPRVDVIGATAADGNDFARSSGWNWFWDRASPRQRTSRLERDTARGYSINVKQVVLAFAVEFVIIGLILVSQFVYAAEFPNPSQYKTVQALLFPVAFAMVELARVPLAIAVRTQNSWNIKLAALIGVSCAVVVTSFSLSQIGHLTGIVPAAVELGKEALPTLSR